MIGVIDYGASNIRSVCNALAELGQKFELIERADSLPKFDKIILPGVGAAGSAMENLSERGFADALPKLKIPVLGLCLGLQLFAEYSEENGTICLSILPGNVVRFTPLEVAPACLPAQAGMRAPEGPRGGLLLTGFEPTLKVPHMGWNKVKLQKASPLTSGIPDGSYFYFVHSYYLASDEFAVGTTDYGVEFPSVIQKDNFYGAQFHPEKSGELGLRVLDNFCRLCPVV